MSDFIYMKPPGGGPVQQITLDPTDENQISNLMITGWRQAAEPASEPGTGAQVSASTIQAPSVAEAQRTQPTAGSQPATRKQKEK
jgi:hypothetical protein